MTYLSQRGRSFVNFEVLLADAFYKQQSNPFEEDKNPEGIINLGTSENKLMFDILMQKFSDGKSMEMLEHYPNYCDFKGLNSFRSVLADFLNHYMKPFTPISADNLIVMNGCGSIMESLANVLAETGDGFLVPAPFYGGFLPDLGLRPGVKSFPVNLSSVPLPGETEPFELSVQRLESAMDEAKKQNVKIRALLLCNPNNPFGYIYSEKLLRECLDFAHKNSLHVIMDEIYMLSIFNEKSSMKCILNLDNIPDKQRLHVVWGFSKDFCVSGFRCGVLYSLNEEVLSAVGATAYFQCVPTTTQQYDYITSKPTEETFDQDHRSMFSACTTISKKHMLMNLISDFEWLDNVYLPTNHKRLRECYKIVCDSLRESDIPYIDSVSGLFLWADFRKLLASQTFKEEMQLFDRFMAAAVYITPGKAFESIEPGWFRIIFSTKPVVLRLAMKRIASVITDTRLRLKNQESETVNGLPAVPQQNEIEIEESTNSAPLEDLVRTLHEQMKESDWLKTNTADKWVQENPELAKAFLQPKSES